MSAGYAPWVRRACILLIWLVTGCVEKIETEMGEEGVPPVLYGWIADGAPLVEGEGVDNGTATDDGGSEATPGADSTGSDTTDDVPQYDEFLAVLEIVRNSCGDPGCHRDGGVLRPVLDDAVAYDNIVGVASSG